MNCTNSAKGVGNDPFNEIQSISKTGFFISLAVLFAAVVIHLVINLVLRDSSTFPWRETSFSLIALTIGTVVLTFGYRKLTAIGKKIGHSIQSNLEQLVQSNAELKSTFRALQQSEVRTSAILRTAMDAILLLNEEGVILQANAASEFVLGVSPEELIGRNANRYFPKIGEECGFEGFLLKRRKGTRNEIEGIRDDGSKFSAEISISMICSDDAILYSLIATDITPRKAAESRIAGLASILEESLNDVLIFSVDDTTILGVNRGVRENLRYSLEELLSKKMDTVMLDASTEAISKLIEPLCTEEKQRVSVDSHLVRRDATTYPVHISFQRVRWSDQDAIVAFAIDMSEYQKLQSELSQAKKLESVGQLAAGVAHEINSPLQFVSDNTEFLAETSIELFEFIDALEREVSSLEEHIPPDRKRSLQEIRERVHYDHFREEAPGAFQDMREGVQRVVEIVRAMRQFSHPGSIDKSLTDINAAVQSTSIVTKNHWKNIADLKLDLDPKVPVALMHGAEINQVLVNLIVNAADAIAQAQKETKSSEKGVILVQTRCSDSMISIEISDNGCGIPQAIIDRIFDPFFTTKDVGQGTGQGLTIVHSIVTKRHGGRIQVRSQVGEGTTFSIELPIPSVVDQFADTDSTCDDISVEMEESNVLVPKKEKPLDDLDSLFGPGALASSYLASL